MSGCITFGPAALAGVKFIGIRDVDFDRAAGCGAPKIRRRCGVARRVDRGFHAV